MVHLSLTKHKPLKTNVRKFLFNTLNDVNGRAGAIIEDATQGGWGGPDTICEHLLSHMFRLHNLSDSVLHLLIKSILGLLGAFSFQFTKVKRKIETCNFLKKNL